MISAPVEPSPTLCHDCREPIDLAETVALFWRGWAFVAACVPCADLRQAVRR